jgi:hypothetical protein
MRTLAVLNALAWMTIGAAALWSIGHEVAHRLPYILRALGHDEPR